MERYILANLEREFGGVKSMNNIEILEDYIKLINKGYCEDCNELCNIYGAPAFPSKAIAETIENLIQENKELKEALEKEKIKVDFLVGKKMIEKDNHAREVKINIENFYIPKSKVKEIVELYDNTLQCTRKYNQDLADILCDLEELLEEGA